MPTRNIYLSESDLALWDEAQQRLKPSVSSVLVECLRRRVNEAKAEAGELDKIVVDTYPDGRHQSVSFFGTWIIPPSNELMADDSNTTYALARTAKGRIAAYTYTSDEDLNYESASLDDFDDIELLRTVNYVTHAYPDEIIAAFEAALGIDDPIELDI
jgi:hypothetical protein